MARNVYEYGRGGKCVYMFRYTYAGIGIINNKIEKEGRRMNAYNKGTVFSLASIGTIGAGCE